MRYLLILTLFCVGCAVSDFKVKQPVNQSIELRPTIKLFESLYNVSIDYTVILGELDPTVAGVCKSWSNGKREIIINVTYYNDNLDNPNVNEQVVLHELGHCTLGLNHRTELLSNGYPKSIMYPYTFGFLNYYNHNKNYYFAELVDKNVKIDSSKIDLKVVNDSECFKRMADELQ